MLLDLHWPLSLCPLDGSLVTPLAPYFPPPASDFFAFQFYHWTASPSVHSITAPCSCILVVWWKGNPLLYGCAPFLRTWLPPVLSVGLWRPLGRRSRCLQCCAVACGSAVSFLWPLLPGRFYELRETVVLRTEAPCIIILQGWDG